MEMHSSVLGAVWQSTGKLTYFNFKTTTQTLRRKLPNLLSFFPYNFEEINWHKLEILHDADQNTPCDVKHTGKVCHDNTALWDPSVKEQVPLLYLFIAILLPRDLHQSQGSVTCVLQLISQAVLDKQETRIHQQNRLPGSLRGYFHSGVVTTSTIPSSTNCWKPGEYFREADVQHIFFLSSTCTGCCQRQDNIPEKPSYE